MKVQKYSFIFLILGQFLLATGLPVAKVNTYTVTPMFDTFARSNGSYSKNTAREIMVKNDGSHYRREGFLSFDLKKYAIPGMIKNVTLRLYVKDMIQSSVYQNIYLTKNDNFVNTSFKFRDKPNISRWLKSYKVSRSDRGKWINIDLPSSAVDRIYKNKKLSMAIRGKTYGARAWVSMASSEDTAHKPQLIVHLNNKEISPESAENVRYLTLVVSREENNFKKTIIGDLDIIDQNGNKLDKKSWTEVQSSGKNFQYLLDSDPTTHWIANGATPHYITIDLKKSYDIAAIVYTPKAIGYFGRVGDFMVYGSSDMRRWSLMASRSIQRGKGNSPKIAYAGKYHTDFTQRRDEFDFEVKISEETEKARLQNSALRSGLQTTGLHAQRDGIVILSVSNEAESNNVHIRLGPWAGSKRYTLHKGLNSLAIHKEDVLYIQASSDTKKNEKVHIIMYSIGTNTYPLFTMGKTSTKEWEKSIEERTYDLAQFESKRVRLTFPASYLDTLDPINFETLAKTYDEMTRVTELAAGIDPRTRNPLHHPDVNKYHYMVHNIGYMATYIGRITFREALTARMIQPNIARDFWGIWHEMGHNLQTLGLTWLGQGEVSVNIYAFAARAYTTPLDDLVLRYDKIFQNACNDLKVKRSYASLASTNREMMFHHLFFIFGEKFFYKLHQRYRENLHEKKDPEFFIGNTEEKMNVMAIMASKVTETNLIEFFDFWKFPLTQSTRNIINNYDYQPLIHFKESPSMLIRYRESNEYDMVF